MIFVQIRKRTGRWVEIPNGPFPIGRVELRRAREAFAAEVAECSVLSGARLVPQTAARSLLEDFAPNLSPFDRFSLGFAVTTPDCRVGKNHDGPWEVLA